MTVSLTCHSCCWALQVIKAAKGSFVVWVAKANSPSARAAARELRAKKVPYLSVVHVCEKTRKMTVKNIHHFKVRLFSPRSLGPRLDE